MEDFKIRVNTATPTGADTECNANFLNQPMEEVKNVILDSGQTPDGADLKQLSKAIVKNNIIFKLNTSNKYEAYTPGALDTYGVSFVGNPDLTSSLVDFKYMTIARNAKIEIPNEVSDLTAFEGLDLTKAIVTLEDGTITNMADIQKVGQAVDGYYFILPQKDFKTTPSWDLTSPKNLFKSNTGLTLKDNLFHFSFNPEVEFADGSAGFPVADFDLINQEMRAKYKNGGSTVSDSAVGSPLFTQTATTLTFSIDHQRTGVIVKALWKDGIYHKIGGKK